MYLDTIGEQIRIFLYSCGFGFVLGFVFDISEFIGEFLPKKRSVTITRDVIYMVVITFATFLFNIAADNGNFKFYIYAAFAAGWFVYYFSVAGFSRRVRFTVSSFFKSFFKGIKLRRKKKTQKKSKKSKISSDLLLQDEDLLLYNKKDNSQQKGSKADNGGKVL